METLKDMTLELQKTPKGKHEGFVDKFLDLLKAGGDCRQTITFDGEEVPLIFYFAYHFNWYGGEVSSKIVKALLPKYSPVELKEILRNENNDLVEQTMYCHSEDNLFQAYMDVDGLVKPEELQQCCCSDEEYY